MRSGMLLRHCASRVQQHTHKHTKLHPPEPTTTTSVSWERAAPVRRGSASAVRGSARDVAERLNAPLLRLLLRLLLT
jgi:hypothetical protein